MITSANVLVVEGLRKAFGSLVAVNDVSFTVQQGSCYGLLGPNGAGKTTAISIIVGVLDADAGSVTLGGEPVGINSLSAKRRIGYVPQDLALYDDLSAHDNLRFFGSLYGVASGKLRQEIERALHVTGLSDRAKDEVKKYSGGMKRRLNIAVALLHDPELLVFDEPTVGVDPQSRNAIYETLEALQEHGKTILYTTHYMEEVERICDRIAVMDHGKIIAEDTLAGLHRVLPERNSVAFEMAEGLQPDDLAGLRRDLPSVLTAEFKDMTLNVEVGDINRDLAELVDWIHRKKLRFRSMNTQQASLEEVFLQLTGRNLRD